MSGLFYNSNFIIFRFTLLATILDAISFVTVNKIIVLWFYHPDLIHQVMLTASEYLDGSVHIYGQL